jgi:uracil-DNA glycosylase
MTSKLTTFFNTNIILSYLCHMNVKIHPSWAQHLQQEFSAPYFQALSDFVRQEYQSTTCYPPGKHIFRAFDLCPFEEVKVVLLGQDPYHEPGQAEGLCFSVAEGVPHPPSLRNIFQEIASDQGVSIPASGSLVKWAEQGVLLLNATLTVRAHQAGSHQGKGWEQFTDAVIAQLSAEREHLVFLLWGSYAQKKRSLIDSSRHLILMSPHPSPLSAYRGFFGNHHFTLTNDYLQKWGRSPICWGTPTN